ncbi:hypothetical protein ACQ27_gp661 [Klebsiella phage K64-1]|uniref:Uncharacterized protein n=1 Tax=Klebsiella phage vB_KleM_RaK2 TaxID=1147094 RepID=H6X4X6_9CAUD|nr:hypothetical protein F403_gp016 [Klebsiella phage vB_KleM_RaK2]YP_010843545.1 hypothetical protein ACQ27_gp661 [Klebsiella phage K64-1]AFA44792.1 hypothetical protein RaK2_00519 [Klebsiella phage vB_KleM_RaK2]QOE32384.1 hypothetical protein CPT_Muenster_212 [Klebsiella phage Muenster]
MKNIFKKEYDGESLCDVQRDVVEAFSTVFNPEMIDIPVDEYGFQEGTFVVSIKWKPE